MVYVRGRVDSGLGTRTELGLAHEPIRIRLKSSHKDIHCDDYGPGVPAEVLWMLSEAEITMTLVHFDYLVLTQCMSEAMGATSQDFANLAQNNVDTDEGRMNNGAGWPLGAGKDWSPTSPPNDVRMANAYVRLSIATPLALPNRRPWRFFSTYLAREPFEIPLGTGRSLVRLEWRAIPYSPPAASGEVASLNARLFDHLDDLSPDGS